MPEKKLPPSYSYGYLRLVASQRQLGTDSALWSMMRPHKLRDGQTLLTVSQWRRPPVQSRWLTVLARVEQ